MHVIMCNKFAQQYTTATPAAVVVAVMLATELLHMTLLIASISVCITT
jgi:hypothetical protein